MKYLIVKVLILVLFIVLFNQPTYAETPTRTTDYRLYLAEIATKYSLGYHNLYLTINCESGWQIKAIGDGGAAYGIAQYHKEAFKRHSNFVGLIGYDYHNPYDQLDLFGRAISLGMANEWTCYPKR